MKLRYIQKDITLFKKVFARYWRTLRFKFAVLVFFDLFGGFLDGVGIGMLVPLFSLVVRGNVGGQDFVSRYTASVLSFFSIPFTIWYLLLVVSAIFLLKAVVMFFLGYLETSVTSQYEIDVKTNLYRDTVTARWPFLMTQKFGHLEYVIVTCASYHARLLKESFNITRILAAFIMYFAVAFSISAVITLVTLAAGLVLLVAFLPIARRLRRYNMERAELAKHIGHDINENILGFKVLKSSGLEETAARNMGRLFSGMKSIWMKQYVAKHGVAVFWQPFIMAFVTGVFMTVYTYQGSKFDIGAFIAIVYLIQKVFIHVQGIQDSIHGVSDALPHIEMAERLHKDAQANQEQKGGSDPFIFRRALEFRDVAFAYEEGRPVLSGVSFMIEKGEMAALVGQSGGGKTTIADLLLRLYEPQRGSIQIDGQDVSNIDLASWRSHIGYVPQEVFLINGIIEENIRLFDEAIGTNDIERAAKAAHLDFVFSLPKGFQTYIGERGIQLSGGQRQRIALARALARNPEILILDEATSSLDAESELKIKEAIEALKGRMTIVVIAHRPSTIMNADKVFVLDSGHIIEHGKPLDLLHNPSSYFSTISGIAQERMGGRNL